MNLVAMNYEQSKESEREKVFLLFEEWWNSIGGDEWHGNGGPSRTHTWMIWKAAFDTATDPMVKL